MRKFFKQFSKNNLKNNFLRESDQYEFVSGSAHELSVTKAKYSVASCQSTGKERPHNEDTLFIINTFLTGLNAPIALGLYLVADGMGGHQSGELASNLAAQGVFQYMLNNIIQEVLFGRESFSNSDLINHLKQAVDEAQALVLQRVPGGGTTLTFVLALGDDLFFAHVGDSRLYLLGKDGSFNLLTRDHSLVKRLVDLGEISASEADVHPYRNILYRALGQSDPFEPDIDVFSMEIGDRLLICSDGLWDVVDQQVLQNILQSKDNLDAAATDLVNAANDAGGPDNISVILVERLT